MCSSMGSATQVMLMTRFRAIVGQKQPEPPAGHQQPWSSERRVPRVDQSGTRTMVIPAMGSRTIHVKRARARLPGTLWPGALRPSNADGSSTCCAGSATQVRRIPPETGARRKTKPHPYRRCPCGKLWWGKDAPFSEHFCAGDGDQVYVEGFSTSSAPLCAQWSEARAHLF